MADQHRTFNLQTIAALRQLTSGISYVQDTYRILADRIELCSHPDNHWYATAISTFDALPYVQKGQFWRCHSKLCAYCTAYHSRESRRRLVSALVQQDLESDERYTFATLTIVNPGLLLSQTREIVNRSWVLFRQSDFWRSLLIGGCKSEEFTLTNHGIHYHLHLLIRTRWFNYQTFKHHWTEAYRKAEHDLGYGPAEIKNQDGYLRCDFRSVQDLNAITFELTKYITKSDSFMKLPPEQLGSLALIQRWHRMFELLGSFRKRAYVHKRLLSVEDESDADAKPPRYWRDRVIMNGYEHEITVLTLRWDRAIDHGRRQLDKRHDLTDVSYGFQPLESAAV